MPVSMSNEELVSRALDKTGPPDGWRIHGMWECNLGTTSGFSRFLVMEVSKGLEKMGLKKATSNTNLKKLPSTLKRHT